ncbi:hypothetical protein [Streptomyces bungoensis]|uniref:hypothetical protein n=1 Tax=Streptomyces bungoensis TaxID=285568 RepID=UPI0033E15414
MPTRAVRTALPGVEPAASRAAAGQFDPLSLRERAGLLRDALAAQALAPTNRTN